MENHNLESTPLKRGQTLGLVTSSVVMQEEQGQIPVEFRDSKAERHGEE